MDDVRISGRLEDVIPATTSIANDPAQEYDTEKIILNVYPNPVSLSVATKDVHIQFKVAQPQRVNVLVYNILGQTIFTAAQVVTNPENRINWNMKDVNGNLVNSGFYFIRVKGRELENVRKILILK